MFLLLPERSRMDDFLQSYKNILSKKNIDTFNANDLEFVEGDLQTVLSAVVVLLRRHSSNGRLCCGNNANNLEVTDVDSWGFVTQVKCMRCNQTMETTCRDAKKTYERIYDKSELKPGDHICWHRCYVIWHHAIVSEVDTFVDLDSNEQKIIHYSSNLHCDSVKVIEKPMPEANSSWNALYRINYHDCYDADYSILRARKLLGETRYTLLRRNCEHFISWCKTGSTNSIQLGIVWASLGKLAFTTVLRVIALVVVLGAITYIHEEQEETTKNRQSLENLERWLTGVYIVMFTVVFIIYLLIKSGSRLHPVSDDKHPCDSCLEDCRRCINCISDCCCYCSRCCRRCCCSCGCRSLILFICTSTCRSFNPSSCTCCLRPCNLVCGLFWCIVIRESLAAGGTLCIVLLEEDITNSYPFRFWEPDDRAAILIFFSTLAHIGGYAIGAFIGRWVQAFSDSFQCSKCCRAATVNNSQSATATR